MTTQRTLSFGTETFRMPAAVNHRRIGAKKPMEDEIGILRAELGRALDFLDAVRGNLPDGYEEALHMHEELKESHAALGEQHRPRHLRDIYRSRWSRRAASEPTAGPNLTIRISLRCVRTA